MAKRLRQTTFAFTGTIRAIPSGQDTAHLASLRAGSHFRCYKRCGTSDEAASYESASAARLVTRGFAARATSFSATSFITTKMRACSQATILPARVANHIIIMVNMSFLCSRLLKVDSSQRQNEVRERTSLDLPLFRTERFKRVFFKRCLLTLFV